MLYMVTFTINLPPMLAYIPFMDPMGIYIYIHPSTDLPRPKAPRRVQVPQEVKALTDTSYLEQIERLDNSISVLVVLNVELNEASTEKQLSFNRSLT